jgi:hypothetical protein
VKTRMVNGIRLCCDPEAIVISGPETLKAILARVELRRVVGLSSLHFIPRYEDRFDPDIVEGCRRLKPAYLERRIVKP